MYNHRIEKLIHSNIFKSLILNLLFLFAALLFCEQKYEVSDDFVMETILSGAYGDSLNPHMLFVNIIFGYILMPLYTLFPVVSWYFLALIVLGFLSFVCITYILFEKCRNLTALCLSVLLLSFFSNDIYVLIQFTKISAFCILSGALLIVETAYHCKKTVPLLLGSVLCILGALIRFQSVFTVAPFILFVVLFGAGQYFKKLKGIKGDVNFVPYYKILLIGGGTLFIILCAQFFNRNAYESDTDYQSYYEYTQARAAIVDSRDLGYGAYQPELEKLGISENDYRMLRCWNFSDPEYFTLNKMKAIAKIVQEKNSQYWGGWQILFEEIQSRKYGAYPIFWACVILFLFGLFHNPKRWYGYVCTGFLSCLMILLFFVLGRVVYRVEYGVFLGTFLLLLYFTTEDERNIETDNSYKTICVVLAGICLIRQAPTYIPDSEYKTVTVDGRKAYIDNVYYDSGGFNGRKYRKVVYKTDLSNGLIQEMESNRDNFYFLEFMSTIQTLYYDWNAFSSPGTDYYQNYVYMSGVTTNFPDINNLLRENGVENPYKSLIKENVYLVDTSMHDTILSYLQEHYYPQARMERVKTVEGYDIWKYYEE